MKTSKRRWPRTLGQNTVLKTILTKDTSYTKKTINDSKGQEKHLSQNKSRRGKRLFLF